MWAVPGKTRSPKPKPGAPAEKTKHHARETRVSAVNPVWDRLALRIQPKLKVSSPADPLERQADDVSDSVMRMPDPGFAAAHVRQQASEQSGISQPNLMAATMTPP